MGEPEQMPMDDDGRRTIARLAADTLPRLIERMTKSELGELEVREDGWRIRLRRPVALAAEAGISAGASAADRTRAAGSGLAGGAHPERSSSAPRSSSPGRLVMDRGMISSPAVGYFSARDGVSNGTNVRSGDVLGHVDVLGVRQEVVAPIDGILGGLEVESGQAIEYGQRIARVELQERG